MNTNRETVLTDEMNMEKVCAKILLKISEKHEIKT
jgi:hypothetical protein